MLSTGWFDFHIGLPTSTASERAAILAQVETVRGLVCAEPTPTEVWQQIVMELMLLIW